MIDIVGSFVANEEEISANAKLLADDIFSNSDEESNKNDVDCFGIIRKSILDYVLLCFKLKLMALKNEKINESDLSQISNLLVLNLKNTKSALEILEVVDLLPYDLQEEAAREELLKTIQNPNMPAKITPKSQGTPVGGSAGGF